MPETFRNAAVFCAQIETEGHKQYFLDTLASYVESLIEMNNLFRRQLLPSFTPYRSNASFPSINPLQGSQSIFFTYFKKMIEARERDIVSDGVEQNKDVHWKKFPLIVGRPESGKTLTIETCIEHCIANNITVCVAVPTGVLACTYRAKYETTITCYSVHSLFLFQLQSYHISTNQLAPLSV